MSHSHILWGAAAAATARIPPPAEAARGLDPEVAHRLHPPEGRWQKAEGKPPAASKKKRAGAPLTRARMTATQRDSDVSDIDVDALMAKYGLGSPVNDEPEVAPAQEQVFESSEEEEEEASPLDTIAEGSEGSDSDDSRPPSSSPRGGGQGEAGQVEGQGR